MFSRLSKLSTVVPKTLYAFGASVLLMPLSLVSGVLIARTIGPDGKGVLDVLLATGGMLVMILGLSLSPGVTYVVAKGNANLRSLTLRLLVVAAVQFATSLIILFVISRTRYSSTFLIKKAGLWVIGPVAVYVILEILNGHWRAMLVGRHQIISVNNVDIISKLTNFGLLVVAALGLAAIGGRLSAVFLFAIAIMVSALVNLALLIKLRPLFKQLLGSASLPEVVRFALPCYLGNLAQFLNYRLDVFIVSAFAGYASVGRYTLAVGLAQLLWLLSNAAATVLLPKVAAAHDADQVGHVSRITRLVLVSTLVGALVLGVVSTQLIPLLYGKGFNGSVPALLWILPGIIAFSTVNVLAAYLAGIGKPRLNLYVSVISLTVTITLDILLIPRFDIVGASIASTVSYTLSAIMTIVLFMRESGARLRMLVLPTAEDVSFALNIAQPLFKHRFAARTGVV